MTETNQNPMKCRGAVCRPGDASVPVPEGHERTYRPDTDVLRRENEIVLLVDVPGAREDGIELTVDRNRLVVRASVDADSTERRFVRREYGVGDYVRTFRLTDDVDRDGIDATLEHGVLRIVLPKAAAALSRRITVRSAH